MLGSWDRPISEVLSNARVESQGEWGAKRWQEKERLYRGALSPDHTTGTQSGLQGLKENQEK